MSGLLFYQNGCHGILSILGSWRQLFRGRDCLLPLSKRNGFTMGLLNYLASAKSRSLVLECWLWWSSRALVPLYSFPLPCLLPTHTAPECHLLLFLTLPTHFSTTWHSTLQAQLKNLYFSTVVAVAFICCFSTKFHKAICR